MEKFWTLPGAKLSLAPWADLLKIHSYMNFYKYGHVIYHFKANFI